MDAQADRLNRLQRNNQQLSAELARVREENQGLENCLSECRSKQIEYMDTIAAVDRSWTQMTDDMHFLAQRLKGFPDVETSSPRCKDEAADILLENGDPFLSRLLQSNSNDSEYIRERLEEMADDATEVEKALMPRSARTYKLFAALIDMQDRHLNAPELMSVKHESGSECHDNPSSKLTADLLNLRKAVDAQRANCRAAEAQKKQLADMLRKDEMEIQELRNELADKKEELNAANRKLHTLKCNDTLISQPSLPIPIARRGSVSPSRGDLDSSESSKVLQKEAKAERDRADSLAKQLRDLQAKIQDESYISQTAAYIATQRQLQAQSTELEKARKMLDTLQRECEGYKHAMQGLMQQAEDARHQRRMVHLTEERIQELEHQVAAARKAQAHLEVELEREKLRLGHGQTVQELQSMIAILEREAQNHRGTVSKRQALMNELEAARLRARSAIAKFEAKDVEAKILSSKLETTEAELGLLRLQEKDLKIVSEDLRVFVEVLQAFCDDPRDLVEVRSNEAKLKSQLAVLQKQMKGHELQVAVDNAQASSVKESQRADAALAEKAGAELEAADLRRQCIDLQQKASTLTADIDAYTTEMEVIGAAYEDMQAKNSRLLQQLAEKDSKNSQVLTEKIQAQHQATRMVEQQVQAESARKLAEQQVVALQERVGALETRLQENLGELGQAMERVTILGQQVEKLCAEVRERDAAIKFRDTQLTTLQNAADQRKRALDEEAEKLHREKVRRVRLEEEVKALHSKVDHLDGDASSNANEDLRLRVRCQVCQVRTKDTVITKCWHTFCGDCIKRNLEARNRKCPTCGHLFGAPDVKQIYL